MSSTIKQRLRRFNGTDYDSIYLSANVADVVGTLSTANGGTGNSSVDTTPTSGSTKMVTSGGVYTEINTLKASVSNGKSAIASAITDKGISTSSSDTFNTMATNIRNISFDFSGANITRDDLVYGKYGWDASGKLITGWREGSVTLTPTSLTLNADSPTGTITVTRAGDGVISASSSDTNVATVSVSGTTVTVSSVTDTFGSATITVNVARGTEHKAVSATCAVTVFVNPISGTVSPGSTVTFAGKSWIVQHVDGNYAYLASNGIVTSTAFSSSNNNVYANSDILKTTCANYETTLGSKAMLYCQSVTVHDGTSKVFIPSYRQYNTEWDWPKASASNRIQTGIQGWYWTSTPWSGDSSFVWHVYSDGSFMYGKNAFNPSGGFRPAVKVRYKA